MSDLTERAVKSVALLVLLLGAMVAPVSSHAQSDSLDQIVVTVNGEPITETEVQSRLRVMRFEADQSGQDLNTSAARSQVIDQAISFTVQRQYARRADIHVTPEEVMQTIESLAQQANLSVEGLLQEFESSGVTAGDVQASISENLLTEKLLEQVLVPRVRLRSEEIDRFVEANANRFREKIIEYDLSVIVVATPLTQDAEYLQTLRNLIGQINSELKSGADFVAVAQSIAQFDGISAGSTGWLQEREVDDILAARLAKASIGQIVGPVLSGTDTIFARIDNRRETQAYSPQPLTQYHLARIVLRATTEAGADTVKEELNNIRENIMRGADFGALAKLYSHDTESRRNGGDLGWISDDELPFEYRDMLHDLELGEISEVKQIQNNALLLHYKGVREANLEEKVRRTARKILRDNKLRIEQSNWNDELRADAIIDFQTTF